jgi:hypothetical protein
MLFPYLASSPTLTMEVTYSSKTSAGIPRTVKHYIPGGIILHNNCCESLTSYTDHIVPIYSVARTKKSQITQFLGGRGGGQTGGQEQVSTPQTSCRNQRLRRSFQYHTTYTVKQTSLLPQRTFMKLRNLRVHDILGRRLRTSKQF